MTYAVMTSVFAPQVVMALSREGPCPASRLPCRRAPLGVRRRHAPRIPSKKSRSNAEVGGADIRGREVAFRPTLLLEPALFFVPITSHEAFLAYVVMTYTVIAYVLTSVAYMFKAYVVMAPAKRQATHKPRDLLYSE